MIGPDLTLGALVGLLVLVFGGAAAFVEFVLEPLVRWLEKRS